MPGRLNTNPFLALTAAAVLAVAAFGVYAQTPPPSSPAPLALYWWADTATPYWYRGKALPSRGSSISVMALTTTADPAELIYQWRENLALNQRASGPGQETFTFTLQLAIKRRIDVTVRDLDQTVELRATTDITPVAPEAGLYAVRPLRGVAYERALTDFAGPAGEPYDFRAVPFFFPVERVSALTYRWTFNGQEIKGEFDTPWLFTIRSNPGEVSLANRLAVEVADPARGGARAGSSLQANFR